MARYTSREPACNRLFSLPWEIMWMIVDHLPSYSRVALALTTKPLFTGLYPTGRVPVLGHYPGRTVFPLPKQSELSERDELLLLLERDNPTMAFCFDCRLLRPLESGRGHLSCAQPTMVKWSWHTFGEGHHHPPLLEEANWWGFEGEMHVHPLAWMPEIKWPVINFGEARLVMNRYLYGEPYGLPLSSLEYNYEFQRFINFNEALGPHFPLDRHPQGRQYLTRKRRKTVWGSQTPHQPHTSTSPWTFKHTSKAKIIDDELYIARVHSIDGPHVERQDFAKLLNSLELPICRHARFHRSAYTCPYRRIYRPPSEFGCLTICKSSDIRQSWSCIDCFTDYSVTICGDELTGWSCTLATYHRLGKCRSPFDPLWKLIIWANCDEPWRMHLRGGPQLNAIEEMDFQLSPDGNLVMLAPTIARVKEDEDWKPGRVRRRWQQSNGDVTKNQSSVGINWPGKCCGVKGCLTHLVRVSKSWSRWRREHP